MTSATPSRTASPPWGAILGAVAVVIIVIVAALWLLIGSGAMSAFGAWMHESDIGSLLRHVLESLLLLGVGCFSGAVFGLFGQQLLDRALNIVINNAGVALLGQFHEIDQAQMEWLFNINFWGAVHATRAFLPHLASQPASHIVNLSSIFGIVAPPGQTAYSAAKFAVRGFSEALRHELQMAKSPIRLSVVHPGGIKTNIVRNSRAGSGVTDNERRVQSIERFDAIAQTSAKDAALRIIKGIEKNEPRILIGSDARFMDLLQRFRPATYWNVMAKRIEKASKRGK